LLATWWTFLIVCYVRCDETQIANPDDGRVNNCVDNFVRFLSNNEYAYYVTVCSCVPLLAFAFVQNDC